MGRNEGEGKVITAGAGESAEEASGEQGEYLKNVTQELKKREQRLARVEQEIQELEFALTKLNSGRAAHRGDATGISSAEAYKKTLRERLAKARQSKAEAQDDVDKARERKRAVEAEIKAVSAQAHSE